MRFSRRMLAAAVFVFLAQVPQGIAEEVKLVNTSKHMMASSALQEHVTIAVSVPFGYAQSQSSFPLLITLDGDVSFGMASEIPRLMSFEGSMPPVIVASVMYGDFRTWITKRQRDYHSKGGGAGKYLKALKTEILPYLKKNYRVKESDITLYGHSSGGWFALFTAIKEPGLFQRVLASSPSVEEELGWVDAVQSAGVGAEPITPKLYVSIGGLETKTDAALESVVAALQKRSKQGRFRFERFVDMPHMAVMGLAYASGMKWLFS